VGRHILETIVIILSLSGVLLNELHGKTNNNDSRKSLNESNNEKHLKVIRQDRILPEAGRKIAQGTIILKFKNSPGTLSKKSSNIYSSFEQKMSKYQGVSLQKIFPSLDKFSLKKVESLDNIYHLSYQNGEDPKRVAADFADDPNIEYAEPLYIYPLLDTPNDPNYINMTQFLQIEANTAWDVVKGEQGGVILAIVDAGTDWRHEDLLTNIWQNNDEIPDNGIDDDYNGYIDDTNGWNFSNNSNDPTGNPHTPQNASHGTHVAGIAAAVTNNNTGVSSISWNCKLMPINVAHPTEDLSVLYGFEGIVYAVLNEADIVSCSWGATGAYSLFEMEIIDFAYKNGTLVVAACGNENSNNDIYHHFPSDYEHVLAVGATNKTSDDKTSFSNYGTSVDVYAPGMNILSTTPNNGYFNLSGTSMACPLTAGLAALIKTQHPEWTVDQVREQIRVTANPIDQVNPLYEGLLGKGRINAYQAVTDFSYPAIRLIEKSFTESGGDGIIHSGDVVEVKTAFTNYLANTSNVTISLISDDENIEITEASAQIPFFNKNDTLNATYLFTVANNLPDGYILRFYLQIKSTNYNDKNYFELFVNPPQFAIHNTGIIQTAITSQGNIGWIDFQGDQSGGVGFLFNGQDHLFEGGLLIGTGPNTVSDCIRGDDGVTQDDDFKLASGEDLTIISPGQYTNEEGSAPLVDSLATSPLGISVLQKTYVDNRNDFNKFIIFRYTLTNLTDSEISNLFIGQFFDWDINTNSEDWANYDISRKMGYIYNEENNPTRLFAAKLLTSTAEVSFRAIHNPDEIYDGFPNSKKWQYLSGKVQTLSLRTIDASILIGEGPFSISPDGSIEVAFAVIGASSLDELRKSADQAQPFWNSIEPEQPENPEKFVLYQNYPNPFNPDTWIKYEIPISGKIIIHIYNALGQKVHTLLDNEQSPGIYQIHWDGKDGSGEKVASGIYFYQLKFYGDKEFNEIKKMILIR
jgi:serine protease